MTTPVTLSDDSLERLAKLLNGNRSTPSPISGTSGITEAANVFKNSSAVTSESLNKLGSAMKLGSDQAVGLVDTFKTFTNVGINFSNDALAFRHSIAGTRLSVQEYGDTISKLVPNITALGGTVTDGTKRFNQMSQEFSSLTAADDLRKIGYTTKEYNDVLAISLAGRKNIDFQDAESRKKANLAAADLALEMDKVAQLTGVSRQEQQRTLQEKQGNARVQAAIEQQVRAGGADAAAAYQKMTTQMKGLGLDKLSDEIYSGQALSQKSIAQLNALGPAGNQLRDAINQVRNATDAESRARADAALREAQAAVARQVTSDQSLNQIRYGQGETAEALGEISISARNYANGIKEEKERARRAGREISDQEAAQNLEKRARFTQELASGKAEKDAQDALTEAKKTGRQADIEAAQARLKEVERAKAEAKPTEALIQVLNRLNDTMSFVVRAGIDVSKGVTNTPEGQAILKNVLEQTANRDKQGVPALERAGILDIKKAGDVTQLISDGEWVKAGIKIGESFVETVKGWFDRAVKTVKDTGAAATGPGGVAGPTAGRADGSIGAVGKLIEDFGAGTPMMLHGKEGVITEEQLKDIVSSIQNSSMVSTRESKTLTTETTTGGGETTTKRTQSEDSKSAQAEMDMLREKFNSDWAKRKEVLVEGMAVEDRKYSKVQAAMKADIDAQKIKEEYESKRAELQKRVDDGIKYEIETKKSAADTLAEIAQETGLKEISIKQFNSDKIDELIREASESQIEVAESTRDAVDVAGLDETVESTQKDLVAKGPLDNLFESLTKNAMSIFSSIKPPDTTQIRGLSRTIPNEIAQSRIESARKVPETTTRKDEALPTAVQTSATLDDLKSELIQLNKTMGEMVSYSSEMVGNIEKQVRATKKLDPNVSLRG